MEEEWNHPYSREVAAFPAVSFLSILCDFFFLSIIILLHFFEPEIDILSSEVMLSISEKSNLRLTGCLGA